MSNDNDFTPDEKLALVANDMMDPKEIGLASAEEAQLALDKKIPRKLGDFITFEASIVPPDVRAKWASIDTKIVRAPNDEQEFLDKWKEEHKNEYLIQCRVRCGTAYATLEQLVNDPVLGFCILLERASDLIQKEYEREKKEPGAGTDILPGGQEAGG